MNSKRFLLIFFFISVSACSSKPVVEEVDPVAVAAPTPEVKTRIKYVYVDSDRGTESGMTTAPFERSDAAGATFGSQVLRVFWPLLTMMATGFAFIVILLGEHLILNRQLKRRAEVKSRLQVT